MVAGGKGAHCGAGAAIDTFGFVDYCVGKTLNVLFHGDGIGGTHIATGTAAAALFFGAIKNPFALSRQIPGGCAAVREFLIEPIDHLSGDGRGAGFGDQGFNIPVGVGTQFPEETLPVNRLGHRRFQPGVERQNVLVSDLKGFNIIFNGRKCFFRCRSPQNHGRYAIPGRNLVIDKADTPEITHG